MAHQYGVDLVVRALGGQQVDQLARQLKGVDTSADKLNGRLRDSSERFIKLGQDAQRAGQSLGGAAKGVGALDRAFGGLMGTLGAGVALGKIAQDALQLDTNLRRLGTVGGDVKALDAGLGDLSERLGGVANKAELAAASYQALSAGFSSTGDALKIVEAATKASVGGMADATQVVEVLTKTLNAYGMSGNQATKVTDSISKAIEYGQVEWSDYTSQLGRVASIAAIAGVSLDEVNAFIAAATKNGATAEIAFTGLGATLNTLLQPTKESQEAAAALGIQWNLAGLKTKGFSGLMEELAQKMGTNQEAAVRLLGSQEAMRGAFAAASKGGTDYKAILEGLGGAAGKTQSDFDKMKGSLANQLKALDTAFRDFGEVLVKAFGPTIVDAVNEITSALKLFRNYAAAIPQPLAKLLGGVISFTAKMWLLQKAIAATVALRAGVVGMLGATAAGATTAGAAAAGATPKVVGLNGALSRLAAFGTITVMIQLAFQGLEELQALENRVNNLRGQQKNPGAIWSGASRETVQSNQSKQRGLLVGYKAQLANWERIRDTAQVGNAGLALLAEKNAKVLRERIKVAEALLKIDSAGYKTQAELNAAKEAELRRLQGPATTLSAADPTPDPEPNKEKLKGLQGRYIQGGYGPSGPNAYGAHFDIKRTDGSYFSRSELDRYVLVNGKPLSSGITVPGGQFGASRDGGARAHNAWDYAFGNGAALTLQGGAKWTGSNSSSYGDVAVFQTPDGKTYRIIHGTFEKQGGEAGTIADQLDAELKIREAREASLKAGQDLNQEFTRELQLRNASSQLEKDLLQTQFTYDDNQEKINKLLDVKQRTELENLNNQLLQLQQQEAFNSELERTVGLMKSAWEGQVGSGPIEFSTDKNDLETWIADSEQQLKELLDPMNQIKMGATLIGESFATAFGEVVKGSKTAQEAFSDMLKKMGDALIDYATQAIAQYIAIGIAKMFAGMLGGGSAGMNQTADNLAKAPFAPKIGAVFGEGGFVTGPTNALIGERGEPEYVLPASKMESAMARYAMGARGEAVLEDGPVAAATLGRYSIGNAEAARIGDNSSASPITLNVTATEILGEKFVKVDDLDRRLAETRAKAARDGAKMGMGLTFNTLRKAPSARQQLGI